jgi:CRP-like cAMP-binding protein
MQFDWHSLYADVKRLGDFSSDAQLAESLGLTRAQISAWRTGKSDLGTLAKLKILDALGHDTLRSAVLSLLPVQNREELTKQHNGLVERVRRGVDRDTANANVAQLESGVQGVNQLLLALPPDERSRIEPHLSPVSLPLGQVIHETGADLTHLYLPTTAIISMLYVMDSGASAEIAIVGNDGLFGITLFMGGATVPNRAIVQSGGQALRLSADIMREEFARGGALQRVFLRYAQALITQMAQTAVCNLHHTVAQKFCRWLLLSLDRLNSNEIRMTQELIANMLGVNRTGASEAARQLQDAGIIRYTRGRIEVLDRAALEKRACQCYRIVKNECKRLFEDL